MRDEEDVMSAITEQGMSRRNFLASMAGVAGLAAAGLAGCSSAGGSKEASGPMLLVCLRSGTANTT